MSESDIELEYDDNLDPDIYLDEDNEDKIQKKPYQVNKNKSELDNDDNNNDYVNDNEEDPEEDDPDEVDDNYDDYDKNDIEFDDEDYNYNEDNIHYIDNELDNDSKIQFIINSEDCITSNILTIYEITELVGIRATQISQGSPVFTDIKNITDPIKMAEKEIIDNKCPLYIKRYIGLDKYELWDPNIMVKPKL